MEHPPASLKLFGKLTAVGQTGVQSVYGVQKVSLAFLRIMMLVVAGMLHNHLFHHVCLGLDPGLNLGLGLYLYLIEAYLLSCPFPSYLIPGFHV